MTNDAPKLLNEDRDPRRWAREFNEVIGKVSNGGHEPINEGLLIAWFANAMMCGEDTYRWRQEAAQSTRSATTTDAIIKEYRGQSQRALAIALADHARFLEDDVARWKRMYECAQNANSYRQDALEKLPVSEKQPSGCGEKLQRCPFCDGDPPYENCLHPCERIRQLERELEMEKRKLQSALKALQSARAATIEECARVCDREAEVRHWPEYRDTADRIRALASSSEREGKDGNR